MTSLVLQGNNEQQQSGVNSHHHDGMNNDRVTVNGHHHQHHNQASDGEKTALEDDLLRRRLILYLSLLTATNRECANAYYKLLTEVQPLLEEPTTTTNNDSWLESLEETMLDEMAVLYTIAGNHPAFTFEQRSTMNELGTKFRNQSSSLRMAESQKYFYPVTQSLIPVQVRTKSLKIIVVISSRSLLFFRYPQSLDPKYGPFYWVTQPIHAVSWQQQQQQQQQKPQSQNNGGAGIGNNNGGGGNSSVGDDARLQSPLTFAFPQYTHLTTMYMPHQIQNPAAVHHQVQMTSPHFTQNLTAAPVAAQTAVPAAAVGIGIGTSQPPPPSHPPPPLQVVAHNYATNPNIRTAGHPPPVHHIPNQAYSPSISNGPVQNIIPLQAAAEFHAQQPTNSVGVLPTSILAPFPSKGQYPPHHQPQVMPQLVPTAVSPRPSAAASNGSSTAVTTTVSISSSNQQSLDGNDSEESLSYNSPESSSSPFQSPSQSLTPSRSQSPTIAAAAAAVMNNSLNGSLPQQPQQLLQQPTRHFNSATTIPPSHMCPSPQQMDTPNSNLVNQVAATVTLPGTRSTSSISSISSSTSASPPPPRSHKSSGNSQKYCPNLQMHTRFIPKQGNSVNSTNQQQLPQQEPEVNIVNTNVGSNYSSLPTVTSNPNNPPVHNSFKIPGTNSVSNSMNGLKTAEQQYHNQQRRSKAPSSSSSSTPATPSTPAVVSITSSMSSPLSPQSHPTTAASNYTGQQQSQQQQQRDNPRRNQGREVRGKYSSHNNAPNATTTTTYHSQKNILPPSSVAHSAPSTAPDLPTYTFKNPFPLTHYSPVAVNNPKQGQQQQQPPLLKGNSQLSPQLNLQNGLIMENNAAPFHGNMQNPSVSPVSAGSSTKGAVLPPQESPAVFSVPVVPPLPTPSVLPVQLPFTVPLVSPAAPIMPVPHSRNRVLLEVGGGETWNSNNKSF